MHLNHLNLVVSNVADTQTLFQTYFNFKCTEVKGDHVLAVLKDDRDFTLVIMADKHDRASYPGAFHIGFMLDSETSVQKIYDQLKEGGYGVQQEPKKIRDSFGFYFQFDQIMLEVGYYLA